MSRIKREYAHLRKSGLSQRDVHLALIQSGLKRNFGNFKLRTARGLALLKKRTYPSKADSVAQEQRVARLVKQKKPLIESTFGLRGEKLGFMLIQPEAMHHSLEIRHRLNKVGAKVLMSKAVVLSPAQLYRVFSHRQVKVYPAFPLNVARLSSAPSRILVFRHASNSRYLRGAETLGVEKAINPERRIKLESQLQSMEGQSVFNRLFKGNHIEPEKGTFRGDLIWPDLVAEGLIGEQNKSGKNASKLNMFGFADVRPQLDTFGILSGIHCPTADEVLVEAATLFSKQDLIKIKSKLTQ